MTLPEPRTRGVEFLERGSYRQRRFRDAARLAPVFAAVFMVLPLLWPRAEPHQSLTSNSMIYLFGVWVGLVVLAFVLSWLVRFGGAGPGDDGRNDQRKPERDVAQDAGQDEGQSE